MDNRPGGSGSIGAAIAAESPADGYTYLFVFDMHAVNPALIPNLPYDTGKDPGTPRSTLDKFHAELAKALNIPELRKQLTEHLGMDLAASDVATLEKIPALADGALGQGGARTQYPRGVDHTMGRDRGIAHGFASLLSGFVRDFLAVLLQRIPLACACGMC